MSRLFEIITDKDKKTSIYNGKKKNVNYDTDIALFIK